MPARRLLVILAPINWTRKIVAENARPDLKDMAVWSDPLNAGRISPSIMLFPYDNNVLITNPREALRMYLIHLIAAARPNFMKIAPLYHALMSEKWAKPFIVHTGQHYDLNMSDVFFRDLRLPEPHIYLAVGNGSHTEQVGRVVISYGKVLQSERPDCVVVVGDVNSTAAAALAAVKMGFPVIHIEAGLRSFDRSMPEEINRLVTDALSDLLLTPSPDADENLLKEGHPKEKIVRVGNIMIDSLEMVRHGIESDGTCDKMGYRGKEFGLVTLHRPSNVDDPLTLSLICEALLSVSKSVPLLFPVHPRTRSNLVRFSLYSQLEESGSVRMLHPLGYIPFMNLLFNCSLAITDSGGLQEETTYLGIPCFTLRPNTERPITLEEGTNRLCTPKDLSTAVEEALKSGNLGKSSIDLWDGQTTQRVVDSLKAFLSVDDGRKKRAGVAEC